MKLPRAERVPSIGRCIRNIGKRAFETRSKRIEYPVSEGSVRISAEAKRVEFHFAS